MAKLTMEDGNAVTIHNVSLFDGDADITVDESPAGGGAPVGGLTPDRSEYTLPRKFAEKLRYATRGEIELYNAEVFPLTDFEIIRTSHGSPNVRVRSRVGRRGA